MLSSALRYQENASDHEDGDDRGRQRPADIQPAFIERLVEEVSNRGSERAGQDEGSPEEQDMRDPGPVIRPRYQRQST